FTVQLNTGTAGNFSGDISFTTNDADENPFNFRVSGTVAVVTAVETHGATTLGTALNHFYLRDNAGAGPSLKAQGTDVVAGQFGGAWAPIAAEKTGSGYEIAWKNGGADTYTLWAADANGNYSGNLIGNVSGSDATLQSAEILFQQDLNGDGSVGLP